MAQYELLLPKMGESVAEANIVKWLKSPGDTIALDETVLEIATDKVDSEVPSPVEGKLAKQLFQENDTVQVGQAIAIIETGGGDGVESVGKVENVGGVESVGGVEEVENGNAHFVQQKSEPPIEDIPGIDQITNNPITNNQITNNPITNTLQHENGGGRFYSPLVRSIAAEEGIDLHELEHVAGSGADGRLTKDDLFQFIKSRKGQSVDDEKEPVKEASPASAQVNPPTIKTSPTSPTPSTSPTPPTPPTPSLNGGDEIIEMDRMRRLIAEHMVMSVQTSPHVTSFVEADVTNLVNWRDRVKNDFEKREGEKITFTPLFVEAVVKALKDLPMVNVQVNGTQIIKKKNINIGMAAALPSGNLIVPVIKNADNLNLTGLTRSVNDLAKRARESKLKPDETQGGTFTITNVGSFGNVMGTPIINQPQVAILAVGAIKKKPAVIETEEGDMIAIRHMMFLSLSYDHRVVDGALGGSFVRKVADYLEKWDVNRSF